MPTTTDSTRRLPKHLARHAWLGRIGLLAGLVAVADALFYGYRAGVSLCVFLALLALASISANPIQAARRQWTIAIAGLILALLPLVEATGLLSVVFGFFGTAIFALFVTGQAGADWPRIARRVFVVLCGDPFGIVMRLRHWCMSGPRSPLPRPLDIARRWFLPVGLGTTFVWLFSEANPLYRSWLRLPDFDLPFALPETDRLLFWALVATLACGFVWVPHFSRKDAVKPYATTQAQGWQMGAGLIVRSLVLFNAIFALQTVLDFVYLWGGAQLPEGVTPAENAQKAAYILVFTALLAGGFVLAAIRNNDKTHADRLVRALIYLWIAQNVVLVASAILRLDLYVELFALTRLRFAAFVWMGLVIAGFVLIVARLQFGKTNAWLVRANMIALVATLYLCSLVDTNAIIAGYNVRHSRELTGRGEYLDQLYLCQLGPSALPAALVYRHDPQVAPHRFRLNEYFRECMDNRLAELRDNEDDWRSWTYRRHRLLQRVAQLIETYRRADDATDDPDR